MRTLRGLTGIIPRRKEDYMSITENGGVVTTMPVSPSGMGGFDGGGWWILLLFILLGNGGFGFGGNDIYPWMNNSQNINDGFRDQALNTSVTSIGDKLAGGFAALSNQLSSNQIAELERSFAEQTANTSGLNAIQGQLSTCCCENRLATVQTQNIVQSEGAATRLAIQQQTQAILDKMCQQEIDNLKAANLALQNQVNMQALAASQVAQTKDLIADNTAQTQYLINRIAPYPIPAYTVANPITPAAL